MAMDWGVKLKAEKRLVLRMMLGVLFSTPWSLLCGGSDTRPQSPEAVSVPISCSGVAPAPCMLASARIHA